MRIFIMTLGVRGEVELFLTLARLLRDRGHDVLLGTAPFFGDQVRQAEVKWTPLGMASFEAQVAALRSVAEIADRVERVKTYAERWLFPQIGQSMQHFEYLAQRAEYFINRLRLTLRRPDGHNLPGAWVQIDLPLPKLNQPVVDQNPPDEGTILNLVAMNKPLVDPKDETPPEYQFTGFWRAEGSPVAEPPIELLGFLMGGPPPVVLAMGSLVMFDPDRLARIFTEALRLIGQRGIIVGGWARKASSAPVADPWSAANPSSLAVSWSEMAPFTATVASDLPPVDPTEIPAASFVAGPGPQTAAWCAPSRPTPAPVTVAGSVLWVDEVPYHWLFPQACCVIHQGGCGTLAEVVRAGVPSILLPQIPSQDLFAQVLEQAHLAAGVFDANTVDAPTLAAAIQRAQSAAEIRRTCDDWQPVMAMEPGLRMAVDLIENHIKSLPSQQRTGPRKFARRRDRGGW